MPTSPSQDDRSYSQHGANYPILAGQSSSGVDENGASNSVLARVTDTSVGNWDSSVSVGDWVRLSARHVWSFGDLALGTESIVHPFHRYGGGTVEVGTLVGERDTDSNGDDVDIAARTISDADAYGYLGESSALEWTGDVFTGTWSDLVGENIVTTGPRSGVVRGSDLSGSAGTVTDQTHSNSKEIQVDLGTQQVTRSGEETWQVAGNGDSGSPLFRESTMELIGVVFTNLQPSTDEGSWIRVDHCTANFGVEFPSKATFNSENTTRTEHALVTNTTLPNAQAGVDVTAQDTQNGNTYGPFTLSGGLEVQWLSAVDSASWELDWSLSGDGTDQPVVHYGGVETNAAATTGQTVSAPVSEATGQTPTPSIGGAGTATVSVPTASATAATPEPTITTAGATVSIPVAAAVGQGPTPVVVGADVATVALLIGEAFTTTPAPSVSGAGETTIQVPVVVSAADTPSPGVTAAGISISMPVAPAAASSPSPSVTGADAAIISAPAVTAVASTQEPNISGAGTATVGIPISSAGAETPPPIVSSGGSLVALVESAATAATPEPSLVGVGTVTVTVPSSGAAASTPSLVIGGAGTSTVSLPAATAMGRAPTPIIGVIDTVPTLTETGVTHRGRVQTVVVHRGRIESMILPRGRAYTEIEHQ